MGSRVKFGIRPIAWINADATFQDRLRWAKRAEALGFDSIHRGDRLLSEAPPAYGSTAHEITTTLTSYANYTEQMKVGSLILVAPFRHPARIAKVFGNLDHLTDGRVILGVGAGWNPHEFETLGIERSSRGKRLQESVEAIKKLWTEDRVEYEGEYYSFEDVTIEPKPPQDPHPPIWFASFGPQVEEFNTLVERVLYRVGRLGDGWVPMTYSTDARSMTSADMLGTAWTKITEGAKQHQRDPDDIEIVYSHYTFVMDDEEWERKRCEEALNWWFDGSYEEAKDIYLIGTANEIIEQINQQTEHLPRVDRYIFTPFTFDQEQLGRLADDIIPALR